MRKPVDIYVRVSRIGGRERLISPDEQERRARDLAREQGLKVGEILTDLDESGGKLDRPGLQEALRRVEAGKSGGVIVAWLDRLSRDSEHAHGLVRRITEAGGAVWAPDAPSDWTTPEGQLQAGIVFAFAQYVRGRSRAGFERAKEQAIARGVPVHTRAAVGYRTREDRRLEPDPETAPVVREAFERRARGEGPAALGAFLSQSGVTTSQGSRTWSKQAVYNMLQNRVYVGELAYGRDRRFVNPASHEPIVDLALFQAAQRPNGARLTPLRSAESEFLLVGIVRCAGCRYALQGTTTSRGKRIYRCTRTRAGGICPAPARVPAEPLEKEVLAAFWDVAAELEAVGARKDTGGAAELEAALERAELRLRQWLSPEVQDAAGDMAEYATGLRERREARDQAAEDLGHARVRANPSEALRVVELRDAWDDFTTAERRRLLASCFDVIAVGRDRRAIAYATGTGPTDLPRRGFKKAPELRPFESSPKSAVVIPL